MSIFIILLSIIVVGCNQKDQEKGQEEKPFVDLSVEEQEQLMEEARSVIEEFNKVNIVKSKEELQTIINHTWVNPEGVVGTMDDVFKKMKSKGYTKLKIDFADEEIIESKKDEYFIYKAKMTVNLTDGKGKKEGYTDYSKYIFKNTDDGYKLEKVDGI